jgi:hypothetical protein
MLFSKVGVYKTEQNSETFIVELGSDADDEGQLIHVSYPLALDEVRNLLRHVELSDSEIERRLRHAETFQRAAAAAS